MPSAFPASVLVVDDEPIVLDLVSRVLRGKGIDFRTAVNADEALSLLSTQGFGCMLADKNLPGIDGMEIVRRVRKSQPYCACILMTAYASTDSAVEALRLGAVDYLEKPFDDLEQVANRVEGAVKAMRAEFERQAVLARLGIFRGEISQNDAPAGEQAELATPIEMLEARVQQATSDLRKRSLHLLSRLVASKAAGREVLLSGEALLEELLRMRRAGSPGDDELHRLELLLGEHLALARHAQSR